MNKPEISMKKIGKYLREISVVVIGVAITLSASYWITDRKKMKINKVFTGSVVGLFLCLFVANAFGQTKSISKEQMIQDIDTLFSTIEKVHPDMYAVYPKQKLQQDIERVKSELKPNGDIFYFFKEITPLVVKLGDGHTNVFFPSDSLFTPFLKQKIAPIDILANHSDILLFPFSVKVTYPDMEIRVQKDYTPTQNTIPVGSQITSINGRKSENIVLEMMDYSSGEKDFYRIDKLEQLFTPLMYTLYRDSIFDIEYLLNHEKHSLQVKGISYKECSEKDSQQDNLMLDNPYVFSTLSDKNIGVIELNLFVADMDKYKAFLDSTFQALQKENIGNLIIDIRKNGGGNSGLGDELFQYISPVPFEQFGKMIVKYSAIQKYVFKTLFNQEVPSPDGIETYNENVKLTELRENNLRYRGNVFLLISHKTFSSAASFSWAFKYFKMGTVIGEETGGMAVCFGDVIPLQLPNTGVLYGCSYKKFYQYGATDDNIHGTLPDYPVETAKALDFTIDLITQRK